MRSRREWKIRNDTFHHSIHASTSCVYYAVTRLNKSTISDYSTNKNPPHVYNFNINNTEKNKASLIICTPNGQQLLVDIRCSEKSTCCALVFIVCKNTHVCLLCEQQWGMGVDLLNESTRIGSQNQWMLSN